MKPNTNFYFVSHCYPVIVQYCQIIFDSGCHYAMHSFSVISPNIVMNHWLPITTFLYYIFRRQYWSIFNHFDAISPQSYRIQQNNAKLTPLRRSRSFKVTDFYHLKFIGLCDFLLVNNTKVGLHSISHCFQVIANYWSNFRFQRGGVPRFNTFIQDDALNSVWNLATGNKIRHSVVWYEKYFDVLNHQAWPRVTLCGHLSSSWALVHPTYSKN